MAYEKIVLLIVIATSFVTPFMGSALNIAIPAIGREFSSSATMLSWVATSYILATATCLLPAGRFADINGRRAVYTAGILLFTIATLLCGIVESVAWLIFMRAIQGIGASFIFSTGMAILAAAYPPESRGKALGYSTASTYIGLSAGPVLGGVISFHFGWRIIFFLSAILGFLVFFMAYRFLRKETAAAAGERFDTVGCLLYMSGLVATLYGFAFLMDGMAPRVLLAAGAILLTGFVRYEIRKDHPLLEIHLFTENVTFAFSNLAAMINYSATFAIGFLASLHLQVVMGLDARVAGWVMLSQPLIMALFSPFAGRLSDKVEPRIVSSIGMALTTLGLLMFAFVTQQTTLPVIIAEMALIGLGFAFFSSPNNNAIMGSVGKEKYGVASSSLATMRMSGQAVSMSIVALIMAMNGGQEAMGAQSVDMVLASTRSALVIFTVLSVAGIFFSLKRGRVR
ncbi:MAG TPA: MFS transporter [Negativicutes bacterium]|nr:MFS transporter [Negativicutes bacterium]